jgi:hypothetical protein
MVSIRQARSPGVGRRRGLRSYKSVRDFPPLVPRPYPRAGAEWFIIVTRGIADLSTWNAPGGHSRGWHRVRRHRPIPTAPVYVRYTVLALAAVLLITLLWRGVRWTMHPSRIPSEGMPAAYSSAPAAPVNPWQHDFADALNGAARDAGAGNLSSAEMGVDRAETIVTIARLQSLAADPDFFAASLANLDRVLQKSPDDPRMIEHVTFARIEIAAFRSSQNPPVERTVSFVTIGAPRELAANALLNPAAAGGQYLDATIMPDTSEILLPPATRTFADNVRVENLTIEGAAQTLDGIRWRNVTFINTRLRYEGGRLDLQNVHFSRCRFGFSTDDRGARLANAIALGQPSITIE